MAARKDGHGEEMAAAAGNELLRAHDGRMDQRLGDGELAPETLDTGRMPRMFIRQQLQGQFTALRHILRKPDLAQAAGAQRPDQSKPGRQCLALSSIGH